MKVIAAIDSFKGSASSNELNHSVLLALKKFDQISELQSIPIADGGEGTMDMIYSFLGGSIKFVETVDLLGRPISSPYLVTSINGTPTAVLESAKILGIDLITPNEETILQANSFGLGLAIKKLMKASIKNFIVTLGGSGTSDGGLGLLLSFTNQEQLESLNENPLINFSHLDLSKINEQFSEITITILSDVKNPYSGPNGAVHTFSAQKGATKEIAHFLEKNAEKVVEFCKKKYGIDLNATEGTGAAGGLGGAFILLGAQIQKGFSYLCHLTHLEEKLKDADLIFTGEGRLDSQSLQGKVPFGIAHLAQKYHVPVIALCGSLEVPIPSEVEQLFTAVFSIQTSPISLTDAMNKQITLSNISAIVPSIFQLYLSGGRKHD